MGCEESGLDVRVGIPWLRRRSNLKSRMRDVGGEASSDMVGVSE